MSESSFVCHVACENPDCGSSDANALYDDGHTHCFACGVTSTPSGATKKTPKEKRVIPLVDGEVQALTKRFITEETCKHFGYRVGEYNGKKVQIAPYADSTGEIVAQKLRFADKTFTFIGEPKKATLFGQHLWRDGGKKVVITEGEIDALSVSQMQGNKWPVVSVPNGSNGARKDLAKHIEWLEKFDEIILFLDNDKAGHAAVQECGPMFTPGKAKIARIPGFKDANEALQSGEGAKIIDAIWGAKEFRPDGVVDVDSLAEEASKPIQQGIPWPWKALTEKTYGIRRRELYGFGAGTGIGKSDTFKEVVLHLVQLGFKCGCVFLEEHPAHTLKVLAGKSVNQRVHIPGVVVPPGAIRSLSDKVYFYNHFGAAEYETIKEKIRFMVLSLGCKDIFLDHLTALAAAVDDDERKAIDIIMADLSALTQQLDCTIYYISHLTTPEGKPHEEGGRVLEKHFRGSRSIAYWSHFLFGLERNKQDVDGVTTFRCLKDRYTGDAAGLTFGLRYDRETGRSVECELPPEGRKHGFGDETGPSTDSGEDY